MFAASRVRRRGSSADYWPGFVDVLSTFLLVIIFLLVVYMLSQHFLQRTLSGQTEVLEELSLQVGELAEMLSLERQANADLRLNISQLSTQLQTSMADHERLSNALSLALSEKGTLQLRLEEKTAEADAAHSEATLAKQNQATALLEVATGKEKINVLLADIERIRRDISVLQSVRAELEAKVTQLSVALETSEGVTAHATEALNVLRDTTAALEARLASEQEQTILAQKELADRTIRLAELQSLYLQTQQAATDSVEALKESQSINESQANRIDLLNQQIAALRSQLGRIEQALETSEQRTQEQESTIANLGKRLNLALAAKVEELAAYRSEFFGRLRQVLHDQQDFTIIGDRFVFQSEVLFESGSDGLEAEGKDRLEKFASILVDVMERIPPDLPWILQVDGHTDRRPIETDRFPSNWELSAARAISVVNHLIDQGIPAHRLSATGYGQFQPIDERDDEAAYRRNRRIELKMTQR